MAPTTFQSGSHNGLGGEVEYEKDHPGSALARNFKPGRQSWQLFKEQMGRALLTFVFCALMAVSLKSFQNDANVSHRYKIIFNVVITALSLALGLNFLEAFKDMAKVLRWRILANRKSTVRETDLILGGESLMKLMTLMLESGRKPVIISVCIVWILFNLGAQIAVAAIGLTYSMDSGVDSTGTYSIPGQIKAAQFDCFYENGICSSAPESNLTKAHNYGEIIRGTRPPCEYSSDSDILNASQQCVYFNNTNGAEFAYRFLEFNPDDSNNAYPSLTNRIIKASVSQCYQYDDPTKPDTLDSQDGQNSVFSFPVTNGTIKNHLAIPRPFLSFDATTYIYNGSNVPQNGTFQSCGDRCVRVWALRSNGVITKRPTEIFSCEVTVSEASNVTARYQVVSDSMAKLAAASITYNGRYIANKTTDGFDWRQYGYFPWGSFWETQGLDAQGIGSRMAEFALGSIANAAALNPSKTQPSQNMPVLGYSLKVNWQAVIPLLVCIAAAHAICVALMLWIARPLVVVDDSNLCVARLLHPLVARLDGKGSLLDGKEIAEAIQARSRHGAPTRADGEGHDPDADMERPRHYTGVNGSDDDDEGNYLSGEQDGRIVYGVLNGAAKSLTLDEGVQMRKRLPERLFPRGRYS